MIDHVFENDIVEWCQLQRLKPSEHGTRVPIKARCAELPVLRNCRRQDEEVTDEPERLENLQIEVRRLGLACGFEQRLTPYALRRGVAYMLDEKVSEINRCFVMGHEYDSKTYFKSYMSRRSKVDVRSVYAGEEQRDIRAMQRIGPNANEAAPTVMSATGYKEIMADPAYIQLCQAQEAVATQLAQIHGTVAAASRTSDPLFIEWKTCKSL